MSRAHGADAAELLGRPHHDGSSLHVPCDAPEVGDTVPVFVRVPHADGAGRVWVRHTPDAEATLLPGVVDRETETDTWWRCDVPVRNPGTHYRFLLDGGRHGYRWLNGTGVHGRDVTDATDFRFTAPPSAPDWAQDAIVYQVFPDRFARSAQADTHRAPAWAHPAGWDDPVDGFGPTVATQLYGGDLDGVTEHLDHLERLGVNTLYLTPVFPAESNHRYNASDFATVDPLLGGDAALARLSDAVHRRGWRLLGDLTANHSGDTHPWFRTAQADAGSPERDAYYFSGTGAQDYEGWLGYSTLPKFRHSSALLRERLLSGPDSVAARWLHEPWGLDGWRVDVANMTGRHGRDDHNSAVARALRDTLAGAGGDRLLLAEHNFDATADLDGTGWHGAMNYSGFTRPMWGWLRHPDTVEGYLGLPVPVPTLPGSSLVGTITDFLAAAPWRATATSWSLLGSHDSARIRTITGDRDRQLVAAGLLFSLPGAPMVFAGDEIGLTGTSGEDSRTPFPWADRDGWDHSALEGYAALARLRTRHEALRRGGLRWVSVTDDAVVFLRETASERLLVRAARAPGDPVRLSATALGAVDCAPSVHGRAPALTPTDGVVVLPADGPAFDVWQMP